MTAILRLIEDQHDRFFPDVHERPPWRIICAHPTTDQSDVATSSVYVVFAVHHSLADGISAAAFHTHLLNMLNLRLSSSVSGSTNGDSDMLHLPKTTDIPLPLEKTMDLAISWSYLLKALWAEFTPTWLRGAQPPPPWTGSLISLKPSQTSVQMFHLPPSALEKVLEACRAHETTLTPLIHALIVCSLSQHVPADQVKSLVASTPINLRPFIDSSGAGPSNSSKHMGVYLTGMEHNLQGANLEAFRDYRDKPEMLEPQLWKVAKEVRADLQERLSTLPKDDVIGLLPWVSDWHARWLKMLGQPRDVTWEVSNIGSIAGSTGNGESEAGWSIDRAVFTQSANMAGPAFSVNVSGIKDRGVTFTFCWQESIVERQLMESLLSDLQTWLLRIAGCEKV